MIIRKDKTYETNSLFPNEDWYNEGNYIVDETTEEGKLLSEKIKQHAPYFNFILDKKGNLIDIEPTEKPMPEPEVIEEVEVNEEKVAMAEAIIQLENKIQELEQKLGGN